MGLAGLVRDEPEMAYLCCAGNERPVALRQSRDCNAGRNHRCGVKLDASILVFLLNWQLVIENLIRGEFQSFTARLESNRFLAWLHMVRLWLSALFCGVMAAF